MYRKESEQQLIDRYIYDVIRRLPKNQREELGLEIRGLIDDMWEESPESTVEEILKRLGTPGDLADKYRDQKHCLIGPEYYDSFIWIAKIVCIAVVISWVVSTIIKLVVDFTSRDIFQIIGSELAQGMMSVIGGVGFLVIIFAVLERQKVKIDLNMKKDWVPEKLPPIPGKKGRISRGDTIVGIVFLIIFMVLLIFYPAVFGVYTKENGSISSIPVFNLDKWPLVLPFLLISLAISLFDEVIKLMKGRYCMAVMVSNIISNVLNVIMAVIILKVIPIWNQSFVSDVSNTFKWNSSADGFLLKLNIGGGTLTNLVLGVIIFGSILEIGVTVYKTIRYGTIATF